RHVRVIEARPLEGSVALAKHDGDAVRSDGLPAGHGEVECSVAVPVARHGRDREALRAKRRARALLEGSVTPAEEDADVVTVEVRDGEVGLAVTVPVSCGERARADAGRQVH